MFHKICNVIQNSFYTYLLILKSYFHHVLLYFSIFDSVLVVCQMLQKLRATDGHM